MRDHERTPGVKIENIEAYKKYASQDKVWLNNFEIDAFLLSRGYILKRTFKYEGTIIEYENVSDGKKSIFLHNNGTDIGERDAAGSHWQGIKSVNTKLLEVLDNNAKAGAKEKEIEFISNLGGGNCGLYAIRDVLENISNTIKIRKTICNQVEYFKQLGELNDVSKRKDIKEAYKKIFKENLEIFRSVADKYYHDASSNSANNEDTIESLKYNRALLNKCTWWGDEKINWKHILKIVGTCGINYDDIVKDHERTPGVKIENIEAYKKHASQDKVWLNNFEIDAFLISRGYILKRTFKYEGTIIEYENVADGKKSIFLHNNGIDIGGRDAAGSHWQGIKSVSTKLLEVLDNNNIKTPTANAEEWYTSYTMGTYKIKKIFLNIHYLLRAFEAAKKA